VSPRERIAAMLASPALGWAAVAAGAVLRVAQYAANRSLWVDESYLAINIVERSFGGLLEPLAHNQAAPFGFLWLERAAVLAFGTSEPALRLVPLAAGLASLPLALLVARRLLRPELVAVAVALVAVSDRLVYYASEVKQYSTDVAVALALLLLLVEADRAASLTGRWLAGLAIAGTAAVWLSHPAIFVLAGGGLALGASAVAGRDGARDWGRVWRLAAVGAIWLASFGLSFVTSLEEMTRNAKRQRFWGDSFMPVGLETPGWLRTAFLTLFENPAGLTPTRLALALFLVGCVYLLATDWRRFAFLLSPLLLCLVASSLRKYPFSNRLLLFVVPALILVVVAGVEAVSRAPRAGPVLAALCAVAVLFQPSVAAARALRHPRTVEEIKPVLAWVRDRRQPGDVVYVYYAAQYPLRYYGPRYGLGEGDYVLGRIARRDAARYREQLDALRGNARVWIVFSHATEKRGIDEQRFFLEHLDGIGTRLDAFESVEAAAYLYDLSGRQREG
jgi:4-amino-4-deoxy-L-arabinose transferase-like glycosyltransferase